MKDSVNVLGTKYKIVIKNYSEDKRFEENSWSGWCSEYTCKIVLCDLKTWPGWEEEPEERIQACMKKTLRHEIVHAFFNESGLSDNSLVFDASWARNEEMVDWFAAQGPKIYKAWQEAGAV